MIETAENIAADTECYRRELQAHCYRMLGSIQESEDAVQETLLRAWRARDQFAARASLRNWLYKIATNVCLNALSKRPHARRSLPALAAPPAAGSQERWEPATENRWLEPYPDTLLEAIPDTAPGPHSRYETAAATQLAFIAAIHYLPPRQRATLLLRDVLGWSAAETAGTLDASVASVNSALQRARETLIRKLPTDEGALPGALSEDWQRSLLDRYVHAWEHADMDGFVALLKEDAIFSMPPYAEWYLGRDAIRGLLSWAWKANDFHTVRMIRTDANRQPAYALYGRRAADTPWKAHALHVLTVDDDRIGVITHYMNEALFPAFGLPLIMASEN